MNSWMLSTWKQKKTHLIAFGVVGFSYVHLSRLGGKKKRSKDHFHFHSLKRLSGCLFSTQIIAPQKPEKKNMYEATKKHVQHRRSDYANNFGGLTFIKWKNKRSIDLLVNHCNALHCIQPIINVHIRLPQIKKVAFRFVFSVYSLQLILKVNGSWNALRQLRNDC